MPLGILRIAACLEKSGHVIQMVDLSGIENFTTAMESHAKATSATFFGITATTPQMPATIKVADAIRAARPDARIVLGGPHPTLVNAALKKERKVGRHGRATRAFAKLLEKFDIIVCGDGEEAITVALQPDSPRVVDVDDPKSAMFLTSERLNELPWPARHLVDVESYHYSVDGKRSLSLLSQLGCPMNCHFCGGRESPMLRRIRTRTTENVVAEVMHLHDTYGVQGFQMWDDELNVNKQMVPLMNAISDAQRPRGLDFRLRGFIKAELFTEEQAEAMYRAGFRWILVGFESGDDRILININKKASREDNTNCLNMARKHGLKIKALMSIGHPGEDLQTIDNTRQWLLEVKPDDFDCTIISTYPGTGYYDSAEQQMDDRNVWTYTHPTTKDKLHSFEIDFTETEGYYKGKIGSYQSYVFTDHITPQQLVEQRDSLEIEIREKLKIAFNPSAAAVRFEHSMGMSQLPPFILRSSK